MTAVVTLEALADRRQRMIEKLAYRPCFGGLDLAMSFDLNAYVLVFPWDHWAVLPWFWIPDDEMQIRARRDGVPYKEWVKAGLVRTTEGDATDYLTIRKDILRLSETLWPEKIYYDPNQAHETAQRLSESGLEMVSCAQKYNLSEASKRLEVLVRRHQISHGGNPVLRWMAEHVGIRTNEFGDIRPAKDHRSIYRVDGIVALIMAIAAALDHQRPKGSVWESDDWTDDDEPTSSRQKAPETEQELPIPSRRASVYEGDEWAADHNVQLQRMRARGESVWELDEWESES